MPDANSDKPLCLDQLLKLTGVAVTGGHAKMMIQGGEISVNETTDGDQKKPMVTALADGGFIVIREGPDGDPKIDKKGVFGRRFDADGVADALGEFRINETTAGDQKNASIAVLIDGSLKFQAGRTFARKAGAFVLSVVLGPLLIVLESSWRLVIWALILIVVPVFAAMWLLLRLLKILLWPLLALFDVVFGFLQRLYPAVIRGALANRVYVLALAAVCLVLTVAGFWRLDTALIPEVHQGEFDLELTLPVGTPLEETLRIVAPLEEIAVADPRVERVVLKVGADPEGDIQPEEGEHTAKLSVMLAPPVVEGGLLGWGSPLGKSIVASLLLCGSGFCVGLTSWL